MLKTLFIGCGGAGSNIAEVIKNELTGLDFCDYLTIDTSAANVKDGIGFTHIKQDSNVESVLSGSGGIRGNNLQDIIKGTKKFIDDKKIHEFNGIIYLIFSSNGGSGNIIAYSLLNELLPKDKVISCIIVHDTTSQQYAAQSKKTLESLYNVSIAHSKALTTIYYNNDKININKVNDIIKKEVKTIVEFNDIENIVDIDAQDMRNFYNPIVYKDSKLVPGIYGLSALEYGNVEHIVKNYEVLVSRTLSRSDIDPLKDSGIKQYKKGTNLKYDSESILLLINNFEKHYTAIKDIFDSYDKEVKMFKIETTGSGLVID